MIRNTRRISIVLLCCMLLPFMISAQQNNKDVPQDKEIEVFETLNFETGEVTEEVFDKDGNILSRNTIGKDEIGTSEQVSDSEETGIPATGPNGEILIPDLDDETIASYIRFFDNNVYVDEDGKYIDIPESERIKSFQEEGRDSFNNRNEDYLTDNTLLYIVPDNRIVVSNTNVNPYKRAGMIIAWYDYNGNGHWDNGELFLGSGSMQGPDVVLTCAHLVKSGNIWSTRAYYYPAKNGGTAPAQNDGTAYSISLTLSSNWAQTWNNIGTSKFEHDYAVMVTNKDVGQGNWFGKMRTSNSIANTSITTLGYPGEKIPRYKMWRCSGPIDRDLPKSLLEMDSVYISQGHSGGPLYRSDNIVVGILVGMKVDEYDRFIRSYGNKMNSFLYNVLQTKLDEGLAKYNY